MEAIRNNHYASWPGLNAKDVAKYFPESEEMWKGHGRKVRAGLRSTKAKAPKTPTPQETPPSAVDPPEQALHLAVFDLKDEMDKKLYSDQTGRFPVTSYRGNQYVMILYDMDVTNYIMAEPMRNRTSGEMVRAYTAAITRLKQGGELPTMHILDNECSRELKRAIKNNEMKIQLVPPHDHRRNAAEKAVQIFKDHFVAVLCGTDSTFPMQLWCHLVPHAEMQLNFLRKSATTPTISAFAHLYGNHNYGAHPFGILGSKVEIHQMPRQRKTWESHTKTGYYLGPAWGHYRCHMVWVIDTKSTRIGQTVFFRHKYITAPQFTASDALIKAGDDLCSALAKNGPNSAETKTVIDMLMDIFKKKAEDARTAEDKRRRAREAAQTQRVGTEDTTREVPEEVPNPTPRDEEPTREEESQPDHPLIIEEEVFVDGATVTPREERGGPAPAIISQDESDAPAYSTRSRSGRLLSAVDVSGSCPSAHQAAQRKFPAAFWTDYAKAVLDEETGELLEYRHLIKHPKYKKDWGISMGNEVGRLAQGMPGRCAGTNTIYFIHKSEVPDDRWRDIAYTRIVCSVRPQKAEPNRTRLTYGGSNLDVPIDCGTPTADLLTSRRIQN